MTSEEEKRRVVHEVVEHSDRLGQLRCDSGDEEVVEIDEALRRASLLKLRSDKGRRSIRSTVCYSLSLSGGNSQNGSRQSIEEKAV